MDKFNKKYDKEEKEKQFLEIKKKWIDRLVYLLTLLLFLINTFIITNQTSHPNARIKTVENKYLVGFIFLLFSIIFVSLKQFGYAFGLLISLVILLKLDELSDLAFSLKSGFSAKFKSPKEKLKIDIIENDQPVTRKNYTKFQNIESNILSEQQDKYGKEMKTQIHFMYGNPDKPEFMYTPDGSLQTDDTLYFFEIKYILEPKFAERIVAQTSSYLKDIYDKFKPMVEKKLVIKFILVSGYDIDVSKFKLPQNIDIEFKKI